MARCSLCTHARPSCQWPLIVRPREARLSVAAHVRTREARLSVAAHVSPREARPLTVWGEELPDARLIRPRARITAAERPTH